MKTIPLTNGGEVLVDDEDYGLVQHLTWSMLETKGLRYARSGSRLMHRVLMGEPKNLRVDHANGNGLDNRRSNLRLATHSQNMANRKMQRNNTSGYRGVSRHGGRWVATIKKDGRKLFLGRYDTREAAAIAYNHAALRLFGEFSRLNLVEAMPMP